MKFFCEIFNLGGDPPSLPLQHPLAARGLSGPFEGVFGEKKFWVNFFGGVGDPPLSRPLQHTLAACGRSGGRGMYIICCNLKVEKK